MGIARSIASKASALPSKVLCVLIVLSLLGPVAPVLARQLINVDGGTPAVQQPAAGRSHAVRTADESWLITWEASVGANASGDGVYVVR